MFWIYSIRDRGISRNFLSKDDLGWFWGFGYLRDVYLYFMRYERERYDDKP